MVEEPASTTLLACQTCRWAYRAVADGDRTLKEHPAWPDHYGRGSAPVAGSAPVCVGSGDEGLDLGEMDHWRAREKRLVHVGTASKVGFLCPGCAVESSVGSPPDAAWRRRKDFPFAFRCPRCDRFVPFEVVREGPKGGFVPSEADFY